MFPCPSGHLQLTSLVLLPLPLSLLQRVYIYDVESSRVVGFVDGHDDDVNAASVGRCEVCGRPAGSSLSALLLQPLLQHKPPSDRSTNPAQKHGWLHHVWSSVYDTISMNTLQSMYFMCTLCVPLFTFAGGLHGLNAQPLCVRQRRQLRQGVDDSVGEAWKVWDEGTTCSCTFLWSIGRRLLCTDTLPSAAPS